MARFEKTADQGVDHGAPSEVASNLQWYRAALLIVIASCTYMSVPLLSGERVLVPSFPTVALTPLLLLTVWRSLSTSDIVFILKISLVLLVSIALSPGYEHLIEKSFGLIQCVMAIGVAILIVRLMQQMRPALLERTLLALWCLLLVGSILEVLGVIREISDSFRAWAYAEAYGIYAGEERDINMVGWLRPKLFSAEPSHVTKFFVGAINSWLLVRVTWGKVAVVAGATLAMLVIMGSPMLLVSAAITLAILMWDQRASLRTKVTMALGTLLIGVIFGAYFGGSQYSVVATRLTRAADSTEMQSRDPNSEAQRMVYPYLTLAHTWLHWPLFGVGIGGKEVVAENTKLILLRNPAAALGNNVMAEVGTYLGLAGGAWFIYLLLRQAHKVGVHRLGLIVVMVALFSQLMGGMETFRFWGFVALLWGALAVADTDASGSGASAGVGIRQ